MDLHHVNVDSDPTFRSDAISDLDPHPSPSFTHVGKSEKFGLLFTAVIVLSLLTVLVKIFNVLDSLVKFFKKSIF
jgi:hypothetical protein